MSLSSLHVNTRRTWRGGEQQTLYLLEGLRRRGLEAILAARTDSPLGERARAAGIEVHSLRPLNEADPLAIWSLARLLRARRPQVLHLHTSHDHSLGTLAAIFAPHTATVVSRRVQFSIYRRTALGLNWIKYRFGVDRYIAISRAVKETLLRDGLPAAEIAVVHSGVDPARWRGLPADPGSGAGELRAELGLGEDLPLVLSAGALHRDKGYEVLLDAAPLVLKRRDAAFVIAGEGAEAAALERRAARTGIGARFRLAGFRRDLDRFLAAAAVFVLPTLHEALGTSILDALIFERPVVASRVGGIPEVIEDRRHGLLVPPRDPAALAGAILELLENPPLGRALAAAGRERVLAEFSADRMVEGTLEAYREALERNCFRD